MKKAKVLYIGLIVIILSLVAVNGYLLNQNKAFREKNRKLLLQNDSIQSVNLILSNNSDTTTKLQKTSLLNRELTAK